MNLLLFYITLCAVHFVQSDKPPSVNTGISEEDQLVLNETITKYGLPKDFKSLGLPGPELLADTLKFKLKDEFNGTAQNYTLRIRAIIKTFSYNARYEKSTLKKLPNFEFPVVKGQFGEYFARKSGGDYIRTIGYTVDENGYREFLIDLSTATAADVDVRIQTTVLITLMGGNPIG